ncbi:MAG: 4Fe-4S dicluster domain-containing protein, partial [Synergistaceae bacterium]|nr:4Fe-4S dicluster domain-containing protein [Synergistaceae bacterium]
RLGIGITVMKCFGGGDLLSAEMSPAGAALTVNQCIAYALSRPAVACVLAGAHSVEQLKEAVAYESASESEKDYALAFASFPRISWKGHCMYCSHCQPCPVKIDIASVTKFLNLAQSGAGKDIPETVREHYTVLEHHAGECVECGSCENRCPFGVKIRNNMKEAKRIFGF